MARDLFGPMGVFTTSADRQAQQQQSQPGQVAPVASQPQVPKSVTVAQQYRLPPNVLMAFEEQGEDPEVAARRIVADLDAGKSFDDIVPKSLRLRATDIANEVTGAAPRQGNRVADFGKQFGGSLVRGLGGAVEMAGVAAETGLSLGAADPNNPSPIVTGTRALGDWIRGAGADMQAGVSPASRKAMQENMPDGDFFQPSTWEWGENPSATGVAMLTADVLGSLLPTVLTAVLTKSPAAAATVGGMMGGGAAAETGRDIVMQAYKTVGPDGRNGLEASSPYYRELIANGIAPDEAANRTAEAGGRSSALLAAPVAGLSGGLTGVILTKPAAAIASRGLGVRILGTGGLSAVEEGSAEVAESVVTKLGVEQATGMDQNLTEGTFGDFLLGAIGGGIPGVAAGALSRREEQQPGAIPPAAGTEAPPAPLALPAPTNGGTIFQPPASNLNPGGDGSAAGQGIAPNMVPPGGLGAMPNTPPAPPMGPLEAAANLAPDLTPQPEPTQMFPDMKPGAQITLMDPETGELIDAVFQREENGIPIVRVGGVEQAVPPDAFDWAVTEARKRIAALEAAARPEKKPTAAPVTPKPEAPTNVPANGMAGGQALGAITGANPAGSGPNQVAPVQAAPVSPAPVASGGEGMAGATGGAEQGQALTPPAAPAPEPEPPKAKAPPKPQAADPFEAEFFDGPDPASFPGDADASMEAYKRWSDTQPKSEQEADKAATDRGFKRIGVNAEGFPIYEKTARNVLNESVARRVYWSPTVGFMSETKWSSISGIKNRDPKFFEPAQAPAEPPKAAEPAQQPPAAPAGQETDPLRAAVSTGIAAGPVKHTTKQGKTLEGYIVKGITLNKAKDTLDKYAFPKDGGVFVRKSGADLFMEQGKEAAPPAEPADAARAKAIATVNRVVKPENKDGTGLYTVSGAEVQIDADKDDAKITVTTASSQFKGRAKVTSENSKTLRYGEVREELAPEARAAVEAEIAAFNAEGEAPVAAAAEETDPNPTPAQAEAENYKTGKADWNGLTLSVENKKGSVRRKVNPDGEVAWEVTMPAHYGRILGTKGADGDHIDFFMGDNEASPDVWVIDQMDAETGRFDEHKVMLGFDNAMDAGDVYVEAFSDGKGKARLGGIRKMSVDEFKEWAMSKPKAPVTPKTKRDDKLAAEKAQTPTVPVKGVQIPELGFLRPGYEYLLTTSGTPSATQTRMTDDGYVVVRETNKTSIRGPQGNVIWAGTYNVDEATVEAEIDKARARRSGEDKPEPAKKGWNRIGSNVRGNALFEDERGVRAYSEGGIRVSESVGIVPGGGISIDKEKRGRDYLTQEEWNNRPGSTSPAPNSDDANRAKRAYDAGFEQGKAGRPNQLPGWIVGSKFQADFQRGYSEGQAQQKPPKKFEIDPPFSESEAFEMGKKAFEAGYARELPDAFHMMGSTAAKQAWFRGWDSANLSAPVDAEPDATALEAVGMVKGKSTAEDAWFRKQAEQGGIAIYKARAVASGWKLTRDFQPGNNVTAPPTRQLGTVATTADAIAQLRENGMRTGVPEEADTGPAQAPKQPAPAAKPAQTGILSALSDDKQKRVAELQAMLAAKVRNQTSSGVDPEYLTLGGELVALYVEAGVKKFGQMLRDFAASTGLSMREAQAPMRVAYNHVRDTMDLDGEDISEFDSADQVMSEIRAAIAEEATTPAPTGESPVSPPAPDSDTMGPDQPGASDEQLGNQEGDQGEPEGESSEEGVDGAGRPDGEPADNGSGEGNEDPAGEPAGNDPDGSMVDGPGSVSNGPLESRRGTAPPNFTITDDFPLGEGTEGEKLAANMAALRLVRALEAENRYATPEEQAVLARWVGWGGLKTVFDKKHEGATTQWGRAQAELRELLSTSEYVEAMRSTNDAHYTSRTVVKAIWRAMRNFGFEGGRALEPTIGSGNFLGLQPKDLADNTEWFAAELDPITGLIAKHLYPQARVFDATGFEDAPFRRAAFDIAIGNPPFGSKKIGNKKLHPDLGKLSVHNFIIAKTGQLLREGGVMGVVVTHRFLDAPNPEARAALAPEFNFLGAIRLPNTAFEANANTSVTTDIVFFQKRKTGEAAGDQSWLETGVAGPNGTVLNGYFAANPDMILGRAAMDGTMYAGGRKKDGPGEFTVHPDGRDLQTALNEAIDKIEATLPTRDEALASATTASDNSSTLHYGAMMLSKDGRIFRGDEDADGNRFVEEVTAESFWKDNAESQARLVRGLRGAIEANASGASSEAQMDARQIARDAAVDVGLVDLAGDPVSQKTKFEQALADSFSNLLYAAKPRKEAMAALEAYERAVERKRLGTDGFERLSGLLDLRQRTRELIALERADAETERLNAKRNALRRAYRRFKDKYGFINNSKNEAILRGDVGPEFALELHYKAESKDGRPESAAEAPILEKRVIFPHKMPESVGSVEDGLHVSMQERGFIDPVLIGKLTGKTPGDVVQELTSGESPLAFLNPKTGHYELAEVYLSGNLQERINAAEDAGLYQNVPHLKNAMPPPKTQDQITPSIRSLWMPPAVFEDFLRAMGYARPKVELLEKVGMASVDAGGTTGLSDFGSQFDTERMTPDKIFEHAIKGKIPVVYDSVRNPDGGYKQVKNEEATKEAVAAYDRMTKEFPSWAYANPDRAARIVDAFNEKMNVVTERKYEGVRYLRMVGNSPNVDLRNSQKNGAWRMIQDAMTLLHHVVGAGKTFTAITGVMERKRMGLTRKAVVAVPNHLTGQWGREWLELYPAANILVPTEKDFEPANRAKLINRIATGDFDAVIIGHSRLTKIQNDAITMRDYIENQITELDEVLDSQKKSGESKRTVGQIGTRLKKLKDKLTDLNEKLAGRADARLLEWKDLGVDYLVVDEAHMFKNLEYATTATQLVGMNPPAGSQRAFDLLMKARTLQKQKGAGIAFLTGTPVSNSLVEIYAMMKYLVPDALESMNIQSFDAWKAAFIQDESRFEYTASMQLKERNIMSGMINLGPLAQLYRSFADIVMRPEVERMFTEQMEARNAAEPDPAKHVPTRFPTPKVKGGARQINLAPPTERMKEFVRYLVMRMAGIKKNKGNKRYLSVDNPLWVLTDARKASVDIRTIDSTLGREQGSKVDRSSDEVVRIWKASTKDRGTQMVFCDMSAPTKNAVKEANRLLKDAYEKIGLKKADLKARIEADSAKSYAERWGDVLDQIEELIASPETDDRKRDSLNAFMESEAAQDAAASMFTADTGFSFYDDMRAALIEKGVPENEIAFIHDYDTSIKKAALFEAVNEGRIRVLLGSTQKMGAGTNAQARLVALHHIDAPWRPSDMEQREGRIIRQGNQLYAADPEGFEVEIIAYSTEQTADVVQWQVLERKASSIETFTNATTDSMVEEGGDADQYAEFMAQSTGKQVFLQKMQAEKDLDTARAEVASAIRMQTEAERYLRDQPQLIERDKGRVKAFGGFSTSLLGAGADTYLSEWDAAVANYQAEKARVEAEADATRKANENLPPAERKKLPEAPKAPSRWSERPSNAYERKIFDTLTRLQAAGGLRAEEIELEAGWAIQIQARPSGTGGKAVEYKAYLVPPKNRELQAEVSLIANYGSADASDFRRSDKLLQALSPANIAMRAQDRAAYFDGAIKRAEETMPLMREIMARGVNMDKVNEAQAKFDRLAALVRVEEVKFASESASLGANYFAERDDKDRDLISDDDAMPLRGDFTFQNGGRRYVSTWGAPNGTRRIEGTDRSGPVAIFQAEDDATLEPVIIEAIRTREGKDGQQEEWSVLNVWEGEQEPVVELELDELFPAPAPRRKKTFDMRWEDDGGPATMEMREDAAPVATLTGNELGPWEDIRQLGRKAEAWYRDNLVGQTVTNEATGMVIGFNARGAKKTTGRKGEDLYRIVPALRDILAGGRLVGTESDRRGRREVKAVHKLQAEVSLAGEVASVIATVREMTDGTFQYDLSMDNTASSGAADRVTEARSGQPDDGGAEVLQGRNPANLTVELEGPTSALEGDPADLNLEFAPNSRKRDAEIGGDDLRAMARDLNAMPEIVAMGGRVPVRVVSDLVSHVTGNRILGRFNAGRSDIEVRAGVDARGVMRHEVIHALRSERLWGKPFGLFSAAEWRELARMAKQQPDIVASVKERYGKESPAVQTEEMVAELYRLWAANRDGYGAVERALLKIEGFLTALANALRGRGFVSAARTMEQIASGQRGGRGPQGPGGGRRGRADGAANEAGGMEMRAIPGTVRGKFAPLVGFRNWRKPGEWVRNFVTDRMVSENASTLALVPGRPLFAEMGKTLLSAKAYLRTKEEMDALRNEWHAQSAEVADKWTRMQSKNPEATGDMMDLMHRSTMTGVDPTKADTWGRNDNLLRAAKIEVSKWGDRAPEWAKDKVNAAEKRAKTYATVKAMYDALPADFQAFYREVKGTYEKLADEWDKALEENLQNAARIAVKNAEKAHRQALRKIRDDGLTGPERDEAIAQADEALRVARARSQSGAAGKIKSLRKIFESQRLKGPYFPLARFGKYFVTVRNEKGVVVSFARMESEAQQQAHVKDMEAKHPKGKVTFGTLDAKNTMRDQVDPKFVAEVEAIVADSGASDDVLDSIWQRYLETLPDDSIRTSKIHRKGREGFSRDALRAFSHHMFHGAHQLARLKYGMSLQEHVSDARDEARRADDPNRMNALVDEMQRRMEFTMNPQGAAWVAAASSLSFVWYLGVSPAAAIVNLSQTTIFGPALMKARFQKVSTGKILSELGRAAKDFGKGQGNTWKDSWSAENAASLTADEKAAMREGYRRGTIDKTQAYDLASVAETGVEYNPFREKWMRRIGWAFHHAERVNREVTYLANYRLARQSGLNHADAIDTASDLTWKTHFSYQNTDRARFMQGDYLKFFMQFRQFQVNALYRLFRDAHQSLNGATAAERKEARMQLIGVSLSMMAHAGIRGVWGYGLIMGLLSLFFPGDADDLEDWMQDALLMEGDSPGVAAWNFAMGAAMNGVPGQITGTSLVERIGMPNLWFREPTRELEGTDLLQHYVNETLGPTFGIMVSMARGAGLVADGELVRGFEAMTPKFVRDVVRMGRYSVEGVQTMNGDAIVESLNPWELIMQANGFTPARVAERYDMNNRLKNREKRILDERKGIHRAASDALASGEGIPEEVLAHIRDFNSRFPEYPITGETIRQSFRGRMRASERNEFGVSLNPKLNDRLREALPPLIYN